MKHVNVLELKDAGDDNDPAAIVTKALADFQATFDGRLKAIETKSSDGKLADRLNSLEAKMNRQGHGTGVIDDQAALETKALNAFLRNGAEKMDDIERKSLAVSGNSALVPPEFGKEVLKLLRQFSPIRQYARVVTIGASAVQYPRRTGSTAATWVADTADRTELRRRRHHPV
jgi:HK97 family phage major capsid protein